MKQLIFNVILSLIMINCKAQNIETIKINNSKKDTMEYFDINRYKNLKPNPKYLGLGHYIDNNGDEIRVMGSFTEGPTVERRKPNSPYRTIKVYHKNSIIKASGKLFYFFNIGTSKRYNENGKLIKETDRDKDYPFSVDDLRNKIKNEYDLDIMNRDKIRSIHRFVDKKELNIPLYEVLVWKDSAKLNLKCYLINGNTGETLFIKDRFENDKNGSLLQNYMDSLEDKKKVSTIYKTHQGKNYTQAEWEAYEEKEYEAYCKRTGRPYTPKNIKNPTEKQKYKNSFLAQEGENGDENTPKKKGFWDNLFK